MFRFILSFFFKPFNKKIKNKTRSSIFAPLKFSLKFIGGFVLLCTLVVVCVDVMSGVNPNAGDKVTIKRVKSKTEEGLYENNANGTINGLNLMLINNITTEQYAKDYLKVLEDFQNGKLTSNGTGLSVGVVLGASVSESGTYIGTPLPKTFLPWDSSANSVLWNKSVSGYPADALTVSKANKNVLSVPYIAYTKGSVYSDSLALGAAGIDNSTGPFQINHMNSNATHSYPKSVLNGYNEGSSREFDASYFPDNLSAMASRLDGIRDSYFTEDVWNGLSDEHKVMLYTIQHNPGPGAMIMDLLNSVDRTNLDLVKAQCEMVINDLKIVNDKYGSILYNLVFSTPAYARAFVALALMDMCGWNYFDKYGTPELLIQYGKYYEEVSGKSAQEIMSNHYGTVTSYARGNAGGSAFTGLTKTSGNITVRLDSICLLHAWQYSHMGNLVYANMLKFAGVDVDPTDPNTYMNKIPDGEWKPSGDTAWMDQYGIKPSEIGPKRTAVLNEGYKWLGSLYTQYNGNADGSQKPPEKDSNGNWIDRPYENGFDCSGYMQYIFRTALGIDITRTTYSQYPNVDNMEFIDESEAKPGDLIYYFYPGDQSTEHVSMYLGKDSTTGLDIIMHAPYFGERLKITTWNGYPGTRRVFKRVKGID